MSPIANGACGIHPFGSKTPALHSSAPRADRLHITELSLDDARLAPFVSGHPAGTVYHHPAWLRTLIAEYNRGIVVLACERQDGHLAGVFPLMRTRGIPLSLFGGLARARLSSLPRTPIAGPLCESSEAFGLLIRAAIDRVSGVRGLHLQVKTENPLQGAAVDSLSGAPWRRSFVLPLSNDPAKLRIGSSRTRFKHIRSSVKKAESLGVRARFASSEEDVRSWYRIYLHTMRRVVVPPRSLRCFLAMWRYMEPLGLMKLLLAERPNQGQTELVAGSIFLMCGKRMSYAFSACPAEYFWLQANDLVHWEAIHWGARNDFREYDFGEVPNDAQQLASYKAKWGGEERQLYRYYYPEIISVSSDSSVLSKHQDLVERVWRQLPLPVTAHLGDLIYSYL